MSRSRVSLELQKIAAIDRELLRLDRMRERVAAERLDAIARLDRSHPAVQKWVERELASEQAFDGFFAFPPIEAPESPGVYAVQGSQPLVKIGRARNIRERVADLQVGRADPLGLLAVLSNDPEKERAFHYELRQWRVRGEWFRLEGEVLTMLQAYREAA